MTRHHLAAVERCLLAEEIMSLVRHPVRNKLGSVRNAAFFIRRCLEKSGLPSDPRVPAFFKLIDEELDLADRYLSGAQIGDREIDWSRNRIPLRECIDSALALRGVPIGVSVSVQCPTELALDLCGEGVTVALGCLLDNACEAIADSGQIVIAASLRQDFVALTVNDSGSGFSAESAAHAFDAFYSTKRGHLGLGLNLVQRVLNELDGSVALEQQVSGGGVTVLFPQTRLHPDPQPELAERS